MILPEFDPDQDGLIQKEQMASFLRELWKLPIEQDYADKYFRLVNGFNTDYTGIKKEDMLTCWKQIDLLALTQVLSESAPAQPGPSYTHNENPGKTTKEGFSELENIAIEVIKNFYKEKADENYRKFS